MVESTDTTSLVLDDFDIFVELRTKYRIAADTIDDFKSSSSYLLNEF